MVSWVNDNPRLPQQVHQLFTACSNFNDLYGRPVPRSVKKTYATQEEAYKNVNKSNFQTRATTVEANTTPPRAQQASNMPTTPHKTVKKDFPTKVKKEKTSESSDNQAPMIEPLTEEQMDGMTVNQLSRHLFGQPPPLN